MGIQFRSLEGICHIGTANRVKDQIKARAARVRGDVIGDLFDGKIDRGRAVTLDDVHLVFARARSKDICTKMFGQLHGKVTNATCAALNQNLLACRDTCAFQTSYAVMPTSGIAAASRMEIDLGLCAINAASASIYSAKAP